MTARRVFLHLGSPKTGTSYLEKILWGHQDQLELDGVWMPGRSRWDHDALMGEVRGGVWRHTDSEWTWARVASECHQRNGDVLVSKEMLAGATSNEAGLALKHLDGLEVHLILTSRTLSSSLPSAWQQTVKANAKLTFGAWLSQIRAGKREGFWRHHDPVSVLRAWGDGLPADRVHVVTMPRSAADPTLLWQRYASVIGVDPAAYQTPDTPANESLGAAQAEYLRRVNVGLNDALPLRQPYRDGVHRPLIQRALLHDSPKMKFGVPDEYRTWLIDRSRQMIDELDAHPCTVTGDLADLEPRLDPDAIVPEEVSEQEIARVGVDAMTRVLLGRQP